MHPGDSHVLVIYFFVLDNAKIFFYGINKCWAKINVRPKIFANQVM